MAQQVVNVGAAANDGTGDKWRDAFIKVNANETELFADLLDNRVIVKSESDLPASVSVGGVNTHVLENKEYLFDGNVTLIDSIGWPGVGLTATIRAINRSVVTYTGGIALFRDPDAQGNIEVEGLTEFRAPGAKMWDLTALSGSFSFQAGGGACKFTDMQSIGTVDGNGTSGP